MNNLSEHLLSKPEPDYPSEALTRGLSGLVNVMVVIDEGGAVISAGPRAGMGPQLLREAAVEAAYKASFKPVMVDGKAIIATGLIQYRFDLPK